MTNCPYYQKDDFNGKMICFFRGRDCEYKDPLNCQDYRIAHAREELNKREKHDNNHTLQNALS